MAEIWRDGNLSIRRLRDDPDDLARMAEWLNRPHVKEWWDPDDRPMTPERVAEKYGPRADPAGFTTHCILKLEGRPIGYLQFYRWASWPQEAADMYIAFDDGTWGFDLFIGEPDLVGIGIGTRTGALACRHLFDVERATSVALTTELTNLRAQRAYEKAGFRRVREVLDLDTRGGERVRSWLMVRERDDRDRSRSV